MNDYFKSLVVTPTWRGEIKDFVDEHHYAGLPNGVGRQCFKLLLDEEMIGAMAYGYLSGANVWKKYADAPEKVLELRRMALVPDTVTNTASFFIARTLKWIRDNTDVQTIVSYADPYHGHTGAIYRATNFEYRGKTPNTSPRIIWNGRVLHNRTRHARNADGSLKPIARRITEALESGQATLDYKNISKYIYVKDLRS